MFSFACVSSFCSVCAGAVERPLLEVDFEKASWRELMQRHWGQGEITIDDGAIKEDARTVDCYLKVGKGHEILLPPRDYDSRVLGHVIMEPSSWEDAERECLEMAGRLRLDLEPLQ